MRIFLDMDGVIADFQKAALELFDCVHLMTESTPGVEIDAQMGFTRKEFWHQIYERRPDFWHHIEPYPWAKSLYDELRKIAPVTILSKPDLNPASLDGKLNWLQRNLGVSPFEDYIFTRHKHIISRPGFLLIDDTTETIDLWRKGGGHAVTFPQPWNTPIKIVYDPQKAVDVVEATRQLLTAST